MTPGTKAGRTPGPWKVEDGGFVGGPVGFGHVCQTWNKFEEDFANAEANAHLIAAAPELLEALKASRDVLDSCAKDTAGTSTGEFFKSKVRHCDAVIARAEGRS